MKQLLQTFLLGLLVITVNGCNHENSNDGPIPTVTGLAGGGGGGSSQSGGTSSSFGGEGLLSFVSANPTGSIGLRGTDSIANKSVITFSVTDSQGNPVAGQTVNFSLNTAIGGVGLSNTQQVTDANGLATTTVAGGDVATVVRVTAESTRNGVTASAQSSQLAITTGIPDQDSFSVSISDFNIEGNDFDGVETEITVRAADRYNNPVADNTAINFTTEGGSIPGSCLTSGGSCSVKLSSQNPRPVDGRVTILVSAIGEESFIDSTPSNGRYDDAETFADTSAEAFRDDNRNGVRDSNELYIDYNSNKAYDIADGLYNGLLCNGPLNCSQTKTTTVYKNVEVVFSESFFTISATPTPINLTTGSTIPTKVQVTVVGQSRGQTPPSGTTITAKTTQGTLEVPTSYTTINSSSAPSTYEFSIKAGTTAGNGTMTITAKSPKGIETILNVPVNQP